MPVVLLLPLVTGFVQTAHAQIEQDTLKNIKSDTTLINRDFNQQNQKIINPYQFDRSTYNYLSPESNRFNISLPMTHYQLLLTGQQSLDKAVIALHKEFNNSITNSRVFRIIAIIASFVNIPSFITHGFVFFKNQSVPVIGVDNPYLYPQTIQGQAYRNFMESRESTQPEKRNGK